jgi:hypothetical protein
MSGLIGFYHSYPQVYPQINLTEKNTICPGVEESGEKWVIEHLDRWGRNVQTSNPPTTKPSYCQTFIAEIADYTSQTSICQVPNLKNPL